MRYKVSLWRSDKPGMGVVAIWGPGSSMLLTLPILKSHTPSLPELLSLQTGKSEISANICVTVITQKTLSP